MTIRKNLIDAYIARSFVISKLNTKLRRISKLLTHEEWRQADRVVNEKIIAWLNAGEPDDDTKG